MILKSYIVEQNLNVLNEYRAVLLYGENDGIKDDIKNKIKDINKTSEIISHQVDIAKNGGLRPPPRSGICCRLWAVADHNMSRKDRTELTI